MENKNLVDESIMDQLINSMVDDIKKTYKIDDALLKESLLNSIQGNKKLVEVINKENDLKKIKRTRVYKDFFNSIKHKVYHDLRRYFQTSENIDDLIEEFKETSSDTEEGRKLVDRILHVHVSTKERIVNRDFYDQIIPYILSSKNILDVGCGLNPMMVPFEAENSKVVNYVAADRDVKAINILDAYTQWSNNEKLKPRVWDIKEGWEALQDNTGVKEYDLALLMKVVPVVLRQERELADTLRAIPAKHVLITGSKTSMTKNKAIEKRERGIINGFIEECGWRKIEEIDQSEEFGWIIAKY